MRIAAWWARALYIAAAYADTWGVEEGLIRLGWNSVSVLLASTPLAVAAFVIGARVFRTAGEDRVRPRPWWQVTGRPRLGFALGYIGVALMVFSAATIPLTVGENVLESELLSIAGLGVASAAYLTAARLTVSDTAY